MANQNTTSKNNQNMLQEPKNSIKSTATTQTKKQLRFSPKSRLHVYQQPNENPEVSFTKTDRKNYARDNIATLRKINNEISQVPSSVFSNQLTDPESVPEGMVFLVANSHLKSKQDADGDLLEPEEMIGLEQYIHGSDYADANDNARKESIRLVVNGWQQLQMARRECEREMKEQGIDYNDDVFGYVEDKIVQIYSKMTRKSVLRARRRANCVHWLNEHSQKNESNSNFACESSPGLRGGKHAIASNHVAGPLRSKIRFLRRSASAHAA